MLFAVIDTVTPEHDRRGLTSIKNVTVHPQERTLKNHLKTFKRIKDDFIPTNDYVEEFQELLKSMGDENGLSEENLKRIRIWQEEVDRGCDE